MTPEMLIALAALCRAPGQGNQYAPTAQAFWNQQHQCHKKVILCLKAKKKKLSESRGDWLARCYLENFK